MHAKLEEDYGLAKRAMGAYERATQVVADEDKFEVGVPCYSFIHDTYQPLKMFTIYIAKATENYGLPAIRPIYERALEGLRSPSCPRSQLMHYPLSPP